MADLAESLSVSVEMDSQCLFSFFFFLKSSEAEKMCPFESIHLSEWPIEKVLLTKSLSPSFTVSVFYKTWISSLQYFYSPSITNVSGFLLQTCHKCHKGKSNIFKYLLYSSCS